MKKTVKKAYFTYGSIIREIYGLRWHKMNIDIFEDLAKYQYRYPFVEVYLTSLEGCPKHIAGVFSVHNCGIKSFKHFPEIVGSSMYISGNNIKSFKDIDQHIKHVGGTIQARNMKITSGFSDLFGIDGLQSIDIENITIMNIANKYLKEKDLIEFQDEMIKAGFESYL